MKNLLSLDEPKVKTLNEKIKRCIEEDTISFTLDEDGKIVVIGDFAGGMDTIGHDDFSFLSWDDFIKHS